MQDMYEDCQVYKIAVSDCTSKQLFRLEGSNIGRVNMLVYVTNIPSEQRPTSSVVLEVCVVVQGVGKAGWEK